MGKATATSNQAKSVKSFAQAVAPQSARPTAGTTTAARPASPKVTEDDVRLLAYLKWESDGRPDGHDLYFWFEAERELLYGG